MSLEDLNRNINRWILDLNTSKTKLVKETSHCSDNKKCVYIRTYREGYAYLIELECDYNFVENRRTSEYRVIGFCKPDSYLTRVEIHLAQLAKLYRHMDKCPYTDWYIPNCLENSISSLENLQFEYALDHCWVKL
jgi:hypothetical protein